MQVRVRMYRQGLGDCFLLTFGTGAAARHVLIDCGTLGTTTNNNPMADVVAHIRATTNDHLHAVIATHEHKDHLSGFASRKADFGAFQIDRFWVAWTENPADQVAQGLKKYNEDLGIAAVMGVEAMRTLASAHPTAGGDELDRLALQHSEINEPVVLHASPAPRGQRHLHSHGRTVPRGRDSVNGSEWIRCCRHPVDDVGAPRCRFSGAAASE